MNDLILNDFCVGRQNSLSRLNRDFYEQGRQCIVVIARYSIRDSIFKAFCYLLFKLRDFNAGSACRICILFVS